MNMFYFFLKHKKRILFLIFLLFLVLVSIFTSKTNTKSPSVFISPTPIPLSNSTSGSRIPTPVIARSPIAQTNQLGIVTFSMPNPSFPTSLATYKVTNYGIDQTQAQNIAALFSMNTTPQIFNSNIYTWASEDTYRSLNIYLDSGILIYSNGLTPGKGDPSLLNITSDNDIKKVTNNFLQKQGYLEKDLLVNKILYHTGDGISPLTNKLSSATLFEVTLKRTINNMPLFYEYGNSDTLSIFIDPIGTVRRFSYVFLSYQPLDQRQLISIEEAKQKILGGEGIITRYGDNSTTNTQAITSTNINSVSIAYLDDSTTGFLAPIFVLTGTSNSPTAANVPIIVYLPAMR